MRVIALSTLRAFWEAHADAKDGLEAWNKDVRAVNWESPNAVKEYASSVSLLSNERVCFNIKGNKYRLIVSVDYENGLVYIKWVGTHSECSKIDAETETFTKFKEGR